MKTASAVFSGAEVRALRDGRKTQFRSTRGLDVMNALPGDWSPPVFNAEVCVWDFSTRLPWDTRRIRCPYGAPGDRLWIKERWYAMPQPSRELLGYVADGDHPHGVSYRIMPAASLRREHSRDLLEITDVRCQRVQGISEGDARAEGVLLTDETADPEDAGTYREPFSFQWDARHAKRGPSWDRNPWVWAISFRRLTK